MSRRVEASTKTDTTDVELALPKQLVKINTGSESDSSSENIPLSELYNRDRGHLRYRQPRKHYAHSFQETDNIEGDSDYGMKREKPYKPGPLSGPSAECIGAQQLISGRRHRLNSTCRIPAPPVPPTSLPTNAKNSVATNHDE